jgi:cellulose synthase/poly-beta-1,6-N-acetylglucosamine synthase-like glycosyltransferase
MSWGFFHEYIQLTSPWTWKAYFKQRRRWMWGNIHAIMHRDVLPLGPAIRISARYFLSLYTFIASAFAIGLIHEHEIQPPQWAFMLFWLSLLAWAANFALSGWINAGVREKGQTALRFWANRLWQTVMAVVLGPFTATWTIVALVSTIYMGNPKSFEVIAKTKETSKLREQRDQKAGERELVAAKEVA